MILFTDEKLSVLNLPQTRFLVAQNTDSDMIDALNR